MACRTRCVFCRHRPCAGGADGTARSHSAREDMKAVGPRGRYGDYDRELDSSPVVALLLFEAADCLMALPASEVAHLLAPGAQRASADEGCASVAWIDVDEYFTGRRSEGPWLQWARGERSARLRVGRVVEVLACAIRAPAPIPACSTPGRSICCLARSTCCRRESNSLPWATRSRSTSRSSAGSLRLLFCRRPAPQPDWRRKSPVS